MKNNVFVLRENDSSHCIGIFVNLLIVFLILIFTASSVSANDENDIWKRYGSSNKLYKGDIYTVNDYKIEAYNFPKLQKGSIDTPFIGLKVYKNDDYIKTITVGLHKSGICDEIKITAVDLPSGQVVEWQDDVYRPWGKIEVAIKGKPKFNIKISTDKEEYQQNSIAKVDIIVRNEGNSDAKNVELEYDTGGLEVDSINIDKSHTRFARRGSIAGELNLKTPETIDKKETYTISVTVTGDDLEGGELLPETKSVAINVLPDSGFISVYSTPSGAKISIDGTYKEITPRTVPVSVGYHTIKLTKSGYKDYTAENIYVSAGETEPISANLVWIVVPTATPTVPKTGYVSVSSTPSNGKTVVVSESLAPITTLKSTPGILETIGRSWMPIIASILIIIAGKKVLIEIRLKEYKTTKKRSIQKNDILLEQLSGAIDKNTFGELEKMKIAIDNDNISEAKRHYNEVVNYINTKY